MHGVFRGVGVVTCVGVVAAMAAAQGELRPNEVGAGLVAQGVDYEALFEGESLEFTTHSGASLKFTMTGSGRASDVQPVVTGAVVASRDGDTVRYARPGVEELYEVRDIGVKQSFRFESLPAGSGDLVVRGRIETELPVLRAAACGLQFGSSDRGIGFGEVTGVDATGATVRGELRWQGGVLEMALPEEFVEGAAFPLLIDPLIGSNFLVHSVSPPQYGGTRTTAVAWDGASQQYLALFSDPDDFGVFGRRMDAQGSTVGPLIWAPKPAYYATAPKVAQVDGPYPWVVTVISYQCFTPSTGVGVIAADGTSPSPGGQFAFAWTDHGSNDVGGGPGGTDAVIIAHNSSSRRLQLAQFDAATQTVLQTSILSTNTSDNSVAISSTGGDTDRYLVTWQRGYSGSGTSVMGAVVDRDLNVLVAPFVIAPGGAFAPDVDGDGTNWVVAYYQGGDIHCRSVTYDEVGGTAIVGAGVTVAGTERTETNPTVAWMGESCLIGYRRQFNGTDWDVWVVTVRTDDCTVCESRMQVTTARALDTGLSLASQTLVDGGNEALIAWAEEAPELPEIRARRFRADDGQVVNLGGGCDGGGSASATCAHVPGNFGSRTQFAEPSSSGLLIIGATTMNFPCGPCTLVPRAIATVPVTTDGLGEAKVDFPLSEPALIGGSLITQWMIIRPGGCFGSLAFSDALQITIE